MFALLSLEFYLTIKLALSFKDFPARLQFSRTFKVTFKVRTNPDIVPHARNY